MSLLLDDKIKFLVGFIFAAIIISVALFIFEALLRKREHRKNRKLQQTPADRIKIYISSSKSVHDKLSFIDRMAKDYFRDMYGFADTSSYSFLIKELEKKNHKTEAAFCKEMFSAFYSKKEITREQIRDVGKMLIEIENHRTVEESDLKDIVSDKIKIPVIDVKTRMKEKDKEISNGKSANTDIEEKEIVSDGIKKMATEDESITRRNIEEIKRQDKKIREKVGGIEIFKKGSEQRILERKKLIDERKAKRAEVEKEKRKRRELKKRRKDDEKQRRREMYWRSEKEKQDRRKMQDRERAGLNRLKQEKKNQERKEKKKSKEEKLEKLKIEKISAINNVNSSVSSHKDEGVASRIVRLEKERLGHSS